MSDASGGRVLVDFRAGLPDDRRIVNDGVMGGRSTSSLTRDDGGHAVFEGRISLENNGGFASFRTTVGQGAMAGAERFLVRVRGDGRRYQLRLRPGQSRREVSYKAPFETTPGAWTTVRL
ncbi:MAG: CIA30 family protein, partial [Longimicrobiales bacterium]|nr:CIA30 family protein [Longimicrobiales bacterium]